MPTLPAKPTSAFPFRLGLCCQFAEEPIAYRTTTATSLLRLSPDQRLAKISALCLANAEALRQSLEYCHRFGIGAFRILSTLLPVKTHPQAGYEVDRLPDADLLVDLLKACGRYAKEQGIRTVFHPDQFVVLNSPREDVVARSIADIESHAELAAWVGADVVNIHAGGVYGNKTTALDQFRRQLDRLSPAARDRITLENDDVSYSPADLLPLCRAEQIPLVYDVHHHRCLPDAMSHQEASAAETWGSREPLFHISSPLEGWDGPKPHRHHDFIDVHDFPDFWRTLHATIEVEAKAKERAVLKLAEDLLVRWPASSTNQGRLSKRPTRKSKIS